MRPRVQNLTAEEQAKVGRKVQCTVCGRVLGGTWIEAKGKRFRAPQRHRADQPELDYCVGSYKAAEIIEAIS